MFSGFKSLWITCLSWRFCFSCHMSKKIVNLNINIIVLKNFLRAMNSIQQNSSSILQISMMFIFNWNIHIHYSKKINDQLLLTFRWHEKRIKIEVVIKKKIKQICSFKTKTEICRDEFNDFTKRIGDSHCLCKSIKRITMAPFVVKVHFMVVSFGNPKSSNEVLNIVVSKYKRPRMNESVLIE